MRKRKYALIVIWLAVLAVVLVPRLMEVPAEWTACRLLMVIDGDTISVEYQGSPVNVRLIGVDAPESVHPEESNNSELGERAHQYMETLTEGTDYVYLELDREEYDTYNRLLAYVYLAEGEAFEESLNYQMVAEGYAINKEYKPNVRYARLLEAAAKDARAQNRGLWTETEIHQIWN